MRSTWIEKAGLFHWIEVILLFCAIAYVLNENFAVRTLSVLSWSPDWFCWLSVSLSSSYLVWLFPKLPTCSSIIRITGYWKHFAKVFAWWKVVNCTIFCCSFLSSAGGCLVFWHWVLVFCGSFLICFRQIPSSIWIWKSSHNKVLIQNICYRTKKQDYFYPMK